MAMVPEFTLAPTPTLPTDTSQPRYPFTRSLTLEVLICGDGRLEIARVES